MTLALPGVAAWIGRLNFSDIDAKCIENREKYHKCHQTLRTFLTLILKHWFRITQVNLYLR